VLILRCEEGEIKSEAGIVSVGLFSQRFAGKCIGKNFRGGFIARCRFLNVSISLND
jgi:hypothetical protein